MSGAVTVARLPYREGESPCSLRNEALRAADGEWVFIVDADAFPAEGCLERLVAAAAEPGIAAVTPRVRAEDGRIEYDAGAAHFLGELCLENAGAPVGAASPPSRSPQAASSCAMLVRREAALDAGLFDAEMGIYRDDLDFALRLRARGWRLAHCPEAVVVHRRAAVPRGPRDLGRRRVYYQTRNRWWTILKHYEARTILLTLPLQLAYEALNLAAAAAEGRAGQAFAAYASVIAGLPALRRSRRRCRDGRRLTDRELLSAPRLSWRAGRRALPGSGALRAACDAACAGYWAAIRRAL